MTDMVILTLGIFSQILPLTDMSGIHFDQAFTRSMNCELEFIRLFFTKGMLQEVVSHSNTYAHIQITQKSSPYTNKEGSWTSTNLEEIERLIAFLVYAGLVKVDSEIENYWSVQTLYHGLWAIEIISWCRYKALMAFLNMVDPVTEDYSNKLCSSHHRILLLTNTLSNQGIGWGLGSS
jgi:hypothetical protein